MPTRGFFESSGEFCGFRRRVSPFKGLFVSINNMNNERKETNMRQMRWYTGILTVVLIGLWSSTPLFAQQMKGMAETKMKQMEMTPGLPTPDLLITTFETSVVVPDKGFAFADLGMGKDFYGKLIAKVDFGKGVMFSVRKARILPGGDVGIMQTTEICYIEEGLGLLIDEGGELPTRVVPAGSWFTVPANWRHTLRNIGDVPLIMHVIRVGPQEIH
jgi:mannose-6-phosphate isomerase-like protein (cupin superfamily)